MNRSGGSISRRELMVGSAAAGGLALLGAPEISFAQTASDVGTTAASGFDDLAGLIRGDLILPGHDAYDESRKVWNGMIDKHPAAIARCTGAADVMDVVKLCTRQRYPGIGPRWRTQCCRQGPQKRRHHHRSWRNEWDLD